jgi:vancomycin permeability regulator SanA
MIPTKSHLRIVVLTVKTSVAIGVLTVASLGIFVVSQFGGNAVFPVDCAVVFGAAVHGTGTAGPGITRRVTTAANLYHEGKVQKLILTGGKGDENKESEAHVMRKVALLQGVDFEDIVLEEEATSTIENIMLTTPLLTDCKSIVGISDRYHLARILSLSRMYDLHERTSLVHDITEFTIHPADTLPTRSFEIRAVLREVAAFLYTFGIKLQSRGL